MIEAILHSIGVVYNLIPGYHDMYTKIQFSEARMAAATVWPPPTPVLGQLGIALGPDMVEYVRAGVEDGRIKYLTIGMSLELRYSLIDN